VYPQVDRVPAGYSPKWLDGILRGKLGYKGTVFSDDLGMHAAKAAGGVRERAEGCLDAGCDLVLVCHPEDIDQLFASGPVNFPDASKPISRLYGKATVRREQIAEVKREGIREWEHWRLSLERMSQQDWS
jgi:beta-N-acetylhexosaminidase